MSRNNEVAPIIIDFNDVFAQARTTQRLSIPEVARATRLPESVIQTIESQDFSHSGTDVYMRGYINIYAKYLNLDENELLRKFDEQKPSFNQNVENSVIAGYSENGSEARQHSVLFSLLTLVSVIGLLGAAYFMVFESKLVERFGFGEDKTITDNQPTLLDLPNGDVTVPQTAAQTVSLPTETTNTTNDDASVSLPSGAVSDSLSVLPTDEMSISANNQTSTETTALPLTAGVTLESDPIIADEVVNDNGNEDAGAETVEPEDGDENAIAVNEDGTSSLSMTFSEEVWISIKDADGKTLTSKIYKKGQKLDVTGKLPLRVKVPRVSSTRDVTFGGKPVSITDFKLKSGRYVLTN